ncbi:eukaryotic translation initiation factor 2-alpha kinase 1-like [Ruditapes philippinarum]|uniref:eukaryotic translation initiation factor 2-alpha kinase 1-like n=1 Tax=Ruditapes philippinarum TaxID=129788 RepID=UPI00295B643D|nr:eukaryotic translation initiation factor 2-alpha kinase 1-like [Ruditapes philippinarum]XP_060557025.1 eukaryotic translation initiation factor 2-alpha kinase 1-like [Ruditapes philippinarum]
MASFKRKMKKPDKIYMFDDSDLSECLTRSNSLSSQPHVPAVPSSKVLPRTVPNHLLLVSILEQLCHMYARDTKQAQDIFISISEQLTKLNVVSPLLMLDEMSSLREQYRHSVHRMLLAAVHKSNKGLTGKLLLPAPNGFSDTNLPALQNNIPRHPSSSSCDLINQTSRYCTEFVEVEKIGKGGFGAVYKSRNKLDGKMYAVKKVKFKHSKPEVWFRVLREVKALASLQHTNIVGYNAAWLEYGTAPLPKPSSGSSLHDISADSDNHSDSENDTGVIFRDSCDGDYSRDFLQPFHDYRFGSGPKIKEIASNNSSLASSPQNMPPSPPKSSTFHKNKSLNDMLEYQGNNTFFGNNFKLDTSSYKKETATVESRALSLLPGKFGNVKTTQTKVKFTLDTSTVESGRQQDEIDGSMYNRGDGRKSQRVYKRSISCDPVASGELLLPLENSSNLFQFVETEFPLQKTVTLYIQMELCSLTLKEWMQNRNETCHSEKDLIPYTDRNMIIFRQILKAVEYIHSQGVIHRDLKPRNIFLQEEGLHVKVGDFGLATDDVVTSPVNDTSFSTLNLATSRLVRTGSILSDHTTGVGTSTYAAPEQLKGSGYNTKCDIYSLGVILFELFQSYGTEMERYRSLSDLRKGIIPDEVFQNWPVQTRYIELMTSENPEVRPSTKSMLSGELFLTKEQVIDDMRIEIDRLRKQLVEKDKMIAEKDSTIAKLLVELSDNSFLAGTSV